MVKISRASLLLFLSVVTSAPGAAQAKPPSMSPPVTTGQRGTKQSPIAVQGARPDSTAAERLRMDERQRRRERNESFVALGTLGLALVTLVLATGTVFLARYTYNLWKATSTLAAETNQAAAEQARKMDASVEAANRSAKAMEASVSAQQDTARKELRAYLTTLVGRATYQERPRLRFEGKPILRNVGRTPAYNVKARTTAAVFPLGPGVLVPPAGFGFPLADNWVGSGLLGPQQDFNLSAILGSPGEFVPDDDVEKIRAGTEQILCVWGEVSYEDIFRKPHSLKFCQLLHWVPTPDGKFTIAGYFPDRHNQADRDDQ